MREADFKTAKPESPLQAVMSFKKVQSNVIASCTCTAANSLSQYNNLLEAVSRTITAQLWAQIRRFPHLCNADQILGTHR